MELGSLRGLTRNELDMGKPESFLNSLAKATVDFKPTIIVNAAAYTAVDRAETEVEQAMAVNSQSVGLLAQFAQTIGSCLVHFSTDYVFDGSGKGPWSETDAPAPLSVYGQTKYLGELAIAKNCTKHLILRTSWVVGAHGANFLKTMLKLAAERDNLSVVADQVGAPTSTRLLAEVTVSLLKTMQHATSDDSRWGTYHISSAGETSWHGYAKYVVTGALLRGAKMKATPDKVLPITTQEYPVPAPRPLNSRLNTQKIQATFGLDIPNWQQGVDQVLDELLKDTAV
jgi:dTDP-4-dehydrorhamnose reductase